MVTGDVDKHIYRRNKYKQIYLKRRGAALAGNIVFGNYDSLNDLFASSKR